MEINLCQLGPLSCFGCCGHSYKNIEKIKQDIRFNTLEFEEIKDLEKFRDRASKYNLRGSGVCRNVIEKNGTIFCPLHPSLNNGNDLRDGHCDINHLCEAFKQFMKWDKEKQNKFVDFIIKLNLDNYQYSIFMDSGELLRRFITFWV